MDDHAYIIYGNGLSVTGIVFIFYQDLCVSVYTHTNTLKHTQVFHTRLCRAIAYFKIYTKYYTITYEKIFSKRPCYFKSLYYKSSYVYILFSEDVTYDHSIQGNFLLYTNYSLS